MHDLNSRIRQLTKLILTSQSVDESKGDDESRTPSPSKLDFDLEPYQVNPSLILQLGFSSETSLPVATGTAFCTTTS